MGDDNIQMQRLGFDDEQRKQYEQNPIEYNKQITRFLSQAREQAKRETCFICGKRCSSFCKSHSVPKFALKNIAVNGKVIFSGIQQEYPAGLPVLGKDYGIGDAGTFSLICNDCDNTLFQDYESPSAYESEPSGKILAQIAMKDYLHMIGKRYYELEMDSLCKEQNPNYPYYPQNEVEAKKLDLNDYEKAFKKAKIASNGGHDDWYSLFYYRKLDYVVPYAAQSMVTLISDFNDDVINYIYNFDADYHTSALHVAVFPLASSSIIIMFTESNSNRYRKFSKQFRKLSEDDQLSAINYIIISYIENVFLSKNMSKEVMDNPFFRDASRKTAYAITPHGYHKDGLIDRAIEEFSLSKRHCVPNLLGREYALSKLSN